MGNGYWYLCHLTFILFKFTLKNFLFLKIMFETMISPSIFLKKIVKFMFKTSYGHDFSRKW